MALNHPNVAAAGGKIYLLGGMIGEFPWTAVGDAFEYDPATDAWKELDPCPRGPSAGARPSARAARRSSEPGPLAGRSGPVIRGADREKEALSPRLNSHDKIPSILDDSASS